MTGKLWWQRLVNSARFLDDIKDPLEDDKSVLLIFDTDIPWLDIMTETLEQKLAFVNDNRTFDVLDVSKADGPEHISWNIIAVKRSETNFGRLHTAVPRSFLHRTE